MALVPFPQPGQPKPAPGDDPDWDDDESTGEAGKMSFLEHLDELRRRIIYSLIAIGIGFGIAFFFIQQLFDFIMKPMAAALPKGQTLVFTEPTEAFTLYIQIAAIAGLLLATPVVMAQVWLFISPGLYTHEKKAAVPFVVLSSIFFILGAAFSHYVVFPLTWKFFVSFNSPYLQFMPRIEPAFGMWMKMLLAFGLVFQMPTIVLFLAKLGLITASFMWRQFKYAILVIFVVAAVITPSGDMFTQTAMATPMIGLYLLSIALAWVFGKKRQPEIESAE